MERIMVPTIYLMIAAAYADAARISWCTGELQHALREISIACLYGGLAALALSGADPHGASSAVA